MGVTQTGGPGDRTWIGADVLGRIWAIAGLMVRLVTPSRADIDIKRLEQNAYLDVLRPRHTLEECPIYAAATLLHVLFPHSTTLPSTLA